jgi:hypothetical protein
MQLTAILNINKSALYCSSTYAIQIDDNLLKILAATGDYTPLLEDKPINDAPEYLRSLLNKALQKKANVHDGLHHVWYMNSRHDRANLLVLEGKEALNELDKDLINIFVNNVAIAYQNLECIEIDKDNCIVD